MCLIRFVPGIFSPKSITCLSMYVVVHRKSIQFDLCLTAHQRERDGFEPFVDSLEKSQVWSSSAHKMNSVSRISSNDESSYFSHQNLCRISYVLLLCSSTKFQLGTSNLEVLEVLSKNNKRMSDLWRPVTYRQREANFFRESAPSYKTPGIWIFWISKWLHRLQERVWSLQSREAHRPRLLMLKIE